MSVTPAPTPSLVVSRTLLALIGATNVLVAGALLLAPRWFFEHIGYFPPFNRHYEGDAGAFLLPWGLGLLLAARTPQRHHTLVGLAALASGLHAANHLYDHLLGTHGAAWPQTWLFLLSTGLTGWLWWKGQR